MKTATELTNAVKGLKDVDYNKVSTIEKTYTKLKKINDPRFGEITIH